MTYDGLPLTPSISLELKVILFSGHSGFLQHKTYIPDVTETENGTKTS